MKKFTALLLILTLLLFSVVGCSSDNGKTEETTAAVTTAETQPASTEPEVVTLKIYAQYSDDDTKIPYDYAVAELAKDYPNVKLELDIQEEAVL